MKKPRLATFTIAILSFILGAWLIFDGTRKLLTGYYTGEQTIGLGSWATIASALAVRPADMAFPFVFLGILWIVNGVIVLLWRQHPDTNAPSQSQSSPSSTPYPGPSSASS